MNTIPLLLAIAATASLASCGGGDSSTSSATDATAPTPAAKTALPRLQGELDMEKQAARYQACLKRMEHYQQLGVWKHGGARPGVDRSAWDKLTEAEIAEVFDIAGCITAGGQVGERMVTVAEEGNGPEIETRRVANDLDFATVGR